MLKLAQFINSYTFTSTLRSFEMIFAQVLTLCNEALLFLFEFTWGIEVLSINLPLRNLNRKELTMNWPTVFQQIIVSFVPLLIVFIFIYQMMKSFFAQFDNQRKQEIRLRFSQETLPIRLQAYERIALLLERVTPESMIMRTMQPGMNVLDLQKALVNSIREEFEHNLSQQIYISANTWAMVTAARQSMIQLIGETASELPSNDQASRLATEILTEFANSKNDPLSLAKALLREEVKEIL